MVAPVTSANPNAQPPSISQMLSNWNTLQQSLQSGDLSSAQSAFSSLSANPPPGVTSSGGTQNNQISSDFNALGQALQSGNLSAAQKAFSTLQADFKAQGKGGRNGHANSDGGDTANSSGSASASASGSSSTVVSEVTAPNPDGTVTVTTTYADGSKATSTKPNSNPVSQNTLSGSNPGQFLTLLNAQEQTQAT